MATQVILLERIEKLGQMGDVVSVKPGYARTYLLPQKRRTGNQGEFSAFPTTTRTVRSAKLERKNEATAAAENG